MEGSYRFTFSHPDGAGVSCVVTPVTYWTDDGLVLTCLGDHEMKALRTDDLRFPLTLHIQPDCPFLLRDRHERLSPWLVVM